MAKRGNGEGSIYRRKSDGRWTGSISLDDGKRKVIYGKTRAEVQEKMKTLLHEQQQGKLVANSSQTVEQFVVDWLENTHRRKVRPRTYERYREAVYLHIVPVLGRIQLQKLTAQHVRAFYTKKADEGLSASTIICYHSVLHLALDMAVKWGIIPRNVCDLVSPPRRERFEIQPLTTEQAEKLIYTVRGHKWEALFILALVTGLRRGEILGLKWQDIDFATGTLQVRRILSRVPTKMPGRTHVYVEAEPKTKQSRRSVTIAPFALAVLKNHQARQLEAKQKADKAWQEHDYVFCTSIGTHLNPNEVVDELKKLLRQAELPNIRFHDLRHSAASLLLQLSVHPKVVQELLGHTQISMTMDVYSHVLPGMHQEAINRLHKALHKPQEDSNGLKGSADKPVEEG
ncbi:MAG: tyrosine recombinase XerC [Ktedonobacteraceae bacterium]